MTGDQYHGKKSDTMFKVPAAVKNTAKKAFDLKDIGFKGATETGWKRAKQLVSKEYISIQDIRYMRNWFARHVYTSYPGFNEWVKAGRPKDKEWHKKRSIISWLTWGGDAGLKWINSNRMVSKLNSYFNTGYTKI